MCDSGRSRKRIDSSAGRLKTLAPTWYRSPLSGERHGPEEVLDYLALVGETADDFIADLAVAVVIGQLFHRGVR